MDPRANVKPWSSVNLDGFWGDTSADAVTCDQAIFTSIFSPTGTGYRLVSASKGLLQDEKQCIIAHSPSHDGLCDPSPDAEGCCFYELPSGRYAIAHSRHAGVEQSGRGALTAGKLMTYLDDMFAVKRRTRIHNPVALRQIW